MIVLMVFNVKQTKAVIVWLWEVTDISHIVKKYCVTDIMRQVKFVSSAKHYLGKDDRDRCVEAAR